MGTQPARPTSRASSKSGRHFHSKTSDGSTQARSTDWTKDFGTTESQAAFRDYLHSRSDKFKSFDRDTATYARQALAKNIGGPFTTEDGATYDRAKVNEEKARTIKRIIRELKSNMTDPASGTDGAYLHELHKYMSRIPTWDSGSSAVSTRNDGSSRSTSEKLEAKPLSGSDTGSTRSGSSRSNIPSTGWRDLTAVDDGSSDSRSGARSRRERTTTPDSSTMSTTSTRSRKAPGVRSAKGHGTRGPVPRTAKERSGQSTGPRRRATEKTTPTAASTRSTARRSTRPNERSTRTTKKTKARRGKSRRQKRLLDMSTRESHESFGDTTSERAARPARGKAAQGSEMSLSRPNAVSTYGGSSMGLFGPEGMSYPYSLPSAPSMHVPMGYNSIDPGAQQWYAMHASPAAQQAYAISRAREMAASYQPTFREITDLGNGQQLIKTAGMTAQGYTVREEFVPAETNASASMMSAMGVPHSMGHSMSALGAGSMISAY